MRLEVACAWNFKILESVLERSGYGNYGRYLRSVSSAVVAELRPQVIYATQSYPHAVCTKTTNPVSVLQDIVARAKTYASTSVDTYTNLGLHPMENSKCKPLQMKYVRRDH